MLEREGVFNAWWGYGVDGMARYCDDCRLASTAMNSGGAVAEDPAVGRFRALVMQMVQDMKKAEDAILQLGFHRNYEETQCEKSGKTLASLATEIRKSQGSGITDEVYQHTLETRKVAAEASLAKEQRSRDEYANRIEVLKEGLKTQFGEKYGTLLGEIIEETIDERSLNVAAASRRHG